jgi:pimeloyl-ACP methyl ester carboxylesterase
MSVSVQRDRVDLAAVSLDVTHAGRPGDPVVVLAHGFPETSWSWRHQIPALARAGFHVLAPDQRGYARSSAPSAIEAYRSDHLTGDLTALARHVGADQAIYVGHDWGALLIWDLARLDPTACLGAVAISVPYTPWPAPPTELFRAAFADRFFYMTYFQQVGPPEAELEADIAATMWRILWGASGEAFDSRVTEPLPVEGTGFLDQFPDPPDALPAWLSAQDLAQYVDAFTASGFRGPLNWYRNLDADHDLTRELGSAPITMPTMFIGGTHDAVIAGRTEILALMEGLGDFRGSHLLEGAGHWTQQERPDEVNELLIEFCRSVT